MVDCQICLEDMLVQNDDQDREQQQQPSAAGGIVATKCGHLFHRGCIGDWLQQQPLLTADNDDDEAPRPSCPVCRQPMRASHLRSIYLPSNAAVAAAAAAAVAATRQLGGQSHSRRCPCGGHSSCAAVRVAKLWCPLHLVCNERCRSGRVPHMCLLGAEPNGQLYCENCCRARCAACRRPIARTCIRSGSDHRVYHAECFPCQLCGEALNAKPYALHLKYNRFHRECLRCTKCDQSLTSKTCQFNGLLPYCQYHCDQLLSTYDNRYV